LLALSILVVILFLMYRYYNKKNKQEYSSEEEEEYDEEYSYESFLNNKGNDFTYDTIADITSTQTANLRYDTQPSFNPLYPVDDQRQHVYYPPDPLPVNIPDVGTVYTRNLYDDPQPYSPINSAMYDYGNVYKDASRSYYNGTYNTYADAQDTEIVNPYGYSNNFNTTTGRFIKGMTADNDKVVTDYQTILDNMETSLRNSLKIGPEYLDVNGPELTMEPPYSVE